MGLKANFKMSDVRKFIEARKQGFENIIIEQLQLVGEQFVADARSTDTYKDRTSNLRGSIGYAILRNGVEIQSNYQGQPEGVQKARKAIKETVAKDGNSYSLIVVAGMDYAIYVEAKGYDVITGSSQTAADDLKRRIKAIQSKIK